MERRLALATAAAAAATFGIGTVCFAALGGSNILGMMDRGTQSIAPATPQTVTRVVVVVGPDGSVTGTSLVVETVPGDESGIIPTDPAVTAPPATPGATAAHSVAPPSFAPSFVAPTSPATIATTAHPSSATTAPHAPARPGTTVTVHTTVPAPATTHATTPATVTTVATVPPTTAKPVTTSTAAPTSTLPAGVPANWPPGKPIPPKPANCKNGQLEDNGVWNCEH